MKLPLTVDCRVSHLKIVDADGEVVKQNHENLQALVALANAHATSEITCPDCEGTGKTKWVLCHASTPDDRPLSAIEAAALATDISKCQFCEATGKVDQVKLLWRRIGQEWKEARKLLAVGMRVWATSAGVPASEYHAMEAGRIEPKESCSPLPKLRERLANAHAAQPGAPREDGSWIVLTVGVQEHLAYKRVEIRKRWYWESSNGIYISEESIVAHRKHAPLEVKP